MQHDLGDKHSEPDLEELARLLSDLLKKTREAARALAAAKGRSGPMKTLSITELAYRARRNRDAIFPAIFGEPAWDILLDLYDKHMTATRVSVTSACVAASVPPTTALRHITLLCNAGLVERHRAETDARLCFVSISPQGLQLMEDWLAGVERLMGVRL